MLDRPVVAVTAVGLPAVLGLSGCAGGPSGADGDLANGWQALPRRGLSGASGHMVATHLLNRGPLARLRGLLGGR